MPAQAAPREVVMAVSGSPDTPACGGARTSLTRLTAWVEGLVQGVGFRWWARANALRLGLAGAATNLPDGRVEIVAEGSRTACEELLVLLTGPGTPGHVTNVAVRWDDPGDGGYSGFIAR